MSSNKRWCIVGCITCGEFTAGQPRTETVQQTIDEMCAEHNGSQIKINASIILYDDEMTNHAHLIVELPQEVDDMMARTHEPISDDVPRNLVRSIIQRMNEQFNAGLN